MKSLRLVIAALVIAAPGIFPTQTPAQQVGNLDQPATKPKSFVVYAAESQHIPAGKHATGTPLPRRRWVSRQLPHTEVRVTDPTRITLQPATGVKSRQPNIHAGTSYSFSFDPSTKLDVYSGDFTVKLPVIATAGEHTMDAFAIRRATTPPAIRRGRCRCRSSLPRSSLRECAASRCW